MPAEITLADYDNALDTISFARAVYTPRGVVVEVRESARVREFARAASEGDAKALAQAMAKDGGFYAG